MSDRPPAIPPRRFLVSCGGTGGHLSPGIALAEGLLARGHEATLLISRKKVDARLSAKYPQLRFERMPGRPFSWHPVRFVLCFASQAAAVGFCLRLLARRRPDGIVGFGGFTSAPVVLAAMVTRVPLALHEANRVPGLAVRALGRCADRVYLPFGVRLKGLAPNVAVHAGLPVRREIVRLGRDESCAALGLDPNRKVLLVFGGSQGASALNAWAREHLRGLGEAGIQIYCLTGPGKGSEEVVEIPAKRGGSVRSVFVPFSDAMAPVLSAADLAVSRAGAGTISELIRCGTPAILVPFPHAADDHQRANAAFFERQGGGLAVDQSRLDTLQAEVLGTIFNDWLLRKFRSNLRRMDHVNSLDAMIRDLQDLAGGASQGGGPAFFPA
ncbi:MAG: UDP-N-acetylglucosamine--N-acetylmuramyl-(pentapeptide) pyrophosphoryl-undecaprenol N-acetylglucosamine transferase [Opitutaceae bacterium]